MGSCFAANQYLVSNVAVAFNATDNQMGYMVSALYFGSMIMVLFFGEFAERVGKRVASSITAAVVCLGALLVTLAPSVTLAIVGLGLYGAGIGGFESTVISLVADKNPVGTNRIINVLQAIFSAGAVLSPLILDAVLPHDRFRAAYIVISALFAATFCYLFTNKAIDQFAVKGDPSSGLAIFRLLKNPLLLCYMLAMILFVATESTVTYWISTYFDRQGFVGAGATALSGYWLASIVGRLAGSRFKSAASLAVPCFLMAAVCAVLLLVVPGAALKIAAVFLFGLAYAPLYGGLQVLGGNLFPESSAAAFSLMVFAGGFGGTVFQPVISSLVRGSSGEGVYVLVAAICVVVAILMFFTNRKAAALTTKD